MKQILYCATVLLAGLLLAACEINIDNTKSNDPDEPYTPQPDSNDRSYGFGQDVEIHRDNYDLTFQYKENTVVLKTQDWQWIDHVEADTIVYFLSGMPEEIRPQVGCPLVLELPEYGAEEILAKVPNGLRNMVQELTETDGLLRCVTTSATLNEIYKTFIWDGAFSALDKAQSIKLTDDLELPLESADISDFGAEENRDQETNTIWGVSDKTKSYGIPPLALAGTRSDGGQDDITSIHHYRKPFFKKIVLNNKALIKYIKWSIGLMKENSEVLGIPESIQTLISFVSLTDVVFTLYVSCDFYSKGNIRTGEKNVFLEPGLALGVDITVDGDLSDVEEETLSSIIHDQDVKDFFANAFRKFNLFKSIPIVIPVVLAPSPVVLNIGVGVRADAEFKISGEVSASAELFKLSLPINLNADLRDLSTLSLPKFSKPRLKAFTLDGSAGLHLIPTLDLSFGINCPPIVHILIGPKVDVDYDFLSLDVENEDAFGWSSDPSLTCSVSATFQATAELDLGGASIMGMKNLFSLETPRLECGLFEKKIHFLPTPTQPSVTTALLNPLTFNSEFNLEPGLLLSVYKLFHPASMAEYLARLLGWEGEPQNIIRTGIQVLDRDTHKVVGCYYNDYSFDPNEIVVKTRLTGLDSGKKYLARPVMRFLNMDIPYSTKTTLFPSDRKLLTYIDNYLLMQYDEQGRPSILMDLLEGGTNMFSYEGDHVSFRYEEDGGYYQSTSVHTNSLGFITKITGMYDDGETQIIECTYSADGHLTHVDNVSSEGDVYSSTYTWKDGLLTRIDWVCSEEGEEPEKGFSTYTYDDEENTLNQQTIALSDDHNLGCLLFTGLFGLPPAKLPKEEKVSDGFSLFFLEDYEEVNFTSAQLSYEFDADGTIRKECVSLKGNGKELNHGFTYHYTTDGISSVPQKRAASKPCHRGPFHR